MKTYDVILADPPWQFRVWNRDTGQGRSAESHYPTMNIQEIASFVSMPILTDKNAVLFLWITWPHLFESKYIIEAWGFEYKTIAWVWVKSKRSGFGFHFGMGYYTRANTEPCLLATKGSMPVAVHDIQALIYSSVREHSRKPDEQYRKIELLYPDCNYLELFARQKRDGWDVWGNEVDSDINLENYL